MFVTHGRHPDFQTDSAAAPDGSGGDDDDFGGSYLVCSSLSGFRWQI
jgi:hypothetical protein